jgi:outer membrane protein assembly factor BamD
MDPGARVKRLTVLFALAGAIGCAGNRDPDIALLASSSDQIIWEAAQEAATSRNWEAARQYFRRIIDGFPQSQYGPGARLGLADSYFIQGGVGNEILAVATYREFLTLYPSHPKADYAQFMLAESQFAQTHSPDRDQTPTELALDEYNRLLDLYPSSPYIEASRARIQACRQSLARSNFLVGLFYQRTRKIPRAAITRFNIVLDKYPDYEGLDEVLFRISRAYVDLGRPAEAIPHLNRLFEVYPESEFSDDAQELMEAIPTEPEAATARTAAGPPQG